jgi:hypothetical protein
MKCDTAISILNAENKALKIMMDIIYGAIQNDATKNNMVKSFFEDVICIIENSITVNNMEIDAYEKLRSSHGNEEYNPLFMESYINLVKRTEKIYKDRIRDLSSDYSSLRGAGLKIDEVVEMRLKTANILLKINQDFLYRFTYGQESNLTH